MKKRKKGFNNMSIKPLTVRTSKTIGSKFNLIKIMKIIRILLKLGKLLDTIKDFFDFFN